LSGGATIFRICDNEFEVDDDITSDVNDESYMKISPLIQKVVYWREHTDDDSKSYNHFPFCIS
jgi:hypothetical protein